MEFYGFVELERLGETCRISTHRTKLAIAGSSRELQRLHCSQIMTLMGYSRFDLRASHAPDVQVFHPPPIVGKPKPVCGRRELHFFIPFPTILVSVWAKRRISALNALLKGGASANYFV